MRYHEISAGQEWKAHWPTVVAAAIGMSLSTIYVYSASTLIEPIEREFGWSRAVIGSGITVLTATAALLGPAIGMAVDRFGSRRLAVPGVLTFCVAFAMVSLATQEVWTWWALWCLVALCGIGVKPTIWTAAVAGLFTRSRGLALAVTLCGTSLGSICVPLLSNWLLEDYGWRGVFVGLALIWGVIGFPIVYFGLRGARDKPQGDPSAPPRQLTGLSVRDSMLTWRFFALTMAGAIFSLVALSLIFSMMPLFSSHGISRGTSAAIAATVGVTALIGRLSTGWLLDRYDPRVVTSIAMALPVITFALLLLAPGSVPLTFVAVMIMGFSLGAEVDAVAFLVGHYFGTRHYGLLFGTVMSALTVATGSAPLVAGFIFDRSGSYDLMLLGAIPLCLLSAAFILTLGRAPQIDQLPSGD